MLRRIKNFMLAIQLDCDYIHTPLFPQKPSAASWHPLSMSTAEHVLGLHTCSPARAFDALPVSESLSRAFLGMADDFNLQWFKHPERADRHVTGSCGWDATRVLLAAAARSLGTVIEDEAMPEVPLISRCRWLRGLALLRHKYLQAHHGTPPLPWFPSPEPGTFLAHIAVHVRRGDLKSRDCARMVSDERYSSAFEKLAPLLAQLQQQWRAQTPRRHLRFSVHVMSDTKQLDPASLEQWQQTFARQDVDMHLHLQNDTFLTMHHLIAADVLVMPQSGFVAAASMYSVGVKLFFDFQDYRGKDAVARLTNCANVRARMASAAFKSRAEGVASQAAGMYPWYNGLHAINLEQPGLGHPGTRSDFLCQLDAHLHWKHRATLA